MDELSWRGGDFRLGDVIVFYSHTIHRAEPNQLDRMRISVDYRFQREGEPVTPPCLLPHFGRAQWDEIYAGWQREDLKYYWKAKNLPLVEWSSRYHTDRPEDFLPGVHSRMDFDEKRRRIGERYGRSDA
jgi:hypothetical protein